MAEGVQLHTRLSAEDNYRLWFRRNAYVGGEALIYPPSQTVDPKRGQRLGWIEDVVDGRPDRRRGLVGRGGTYLVPHEREDPVDFAERLANAYGLDLSGPVIDKYVSAVFARPIKREGIDAALLDDIDRAGASADTFFAEVARWTGVYSRCFVVTDMPRSDREGGYRNLAEERAARAGQPYSWLCHPQTVLDWQLDDYGRCSGALIVEGNEPVAFDPRKPREPGRRLVKAWWPDRWELYAIGEDNRGEVVSSGDNPHGFVPVVPVVFRPVESTSSDDLCGRSLIQGVAPIQLEILQLLSFVSEYHRNCGFPQLWTPQMMGREIRPETEITMGQRTVLSYDKEAGVPLWLSPPVDQVQELRGHVEWLVQRAMEAAGVARRASQSNQVASGDALSWEWLDFGFLAGAFAQCLEDAERKVHAMRAAMKAGAKDYDPESVEVAYPRQFRPEDASALLDEMQRIVDLGLGGAFRREALAHNARRYLAHLPPEDLDDVIDEMEKDADEERETTKALDAKIREDAAKPPAPPLAFGMKRPMDKPMMPLAKGAPEEHEAA